MENTQPENDNPVVSIKHPVLAQLNARIAELETQLSKLQAEYETLDSRYAREIRARQDRETYTQEAFVSAIECGYDKETIVHLAYELDVELTQTKTYTVQVEFQVEAIVEIGEELDVHSLDFSMSGDNIQDYSYDVASIDEN